MNGSGLGCQSICDVYWIKMTRKFPEATWQLCVWNRLSLFTENCM